VIEDDSLPEGWMNAKTVVPCSSVNGKRGPRPKPVDTRVQGFHLSGGHSVWVLKLEGRRSGREKKDHGRVRVGV
jgi:hypothetical protein